MYFRLKSQFFVFAASNKLTICDLTFFTFFFRHYDKSKGGLQVEIRDPAEVRRAKIRKVVFFVILALVILIIMIIIIVVVVQENAPTQKEVTRGKIKNVFGKTEFIISTPMLI